MNKACELTKKCRWNVSTSNGDGPSRDGSLGPRHLPTQPLVCSARCVLGHCELVCCRVSLKRILQGSGFSFNEQGEGKWFQLINFHHCGLTEMCTFLATLPQPPGAGSAVSRPTFCAGPVLDTWHACSRFLLTQTNFHSVLVRQISSFISHTGIYCFDRKLDNFLKRFLYLESISQSNSGSVYLRFYLIKV